MLIGAVIAATSLEMKTLTFILKLPFLLLFFVVVVPFLRWAYGDGQDY